MTKHTELFERIVNGTGTAEQGKASQEVQQGQEAPKQGKEKPEQDIMLFVRLVQKQKQ